MHHVPLLTLDGEHRVFSAHVIANTALQRDEYEALKFSIKKQLEPFGFGHTTIEIEFPNEICGMDACEDEKIEPIYV